MGGAVKRTWDHHYCLGNFQIQIRLYYFAEAWVQGGKDNEKHILTFEWRQTKQMQSRRQVESDNIKNREQSSTVLWMSFMSSDTLLESLDEGSGRLALGVSKREEWVRAVSCQGRQILRVAPSWRIWGLHRGKYCEASGSLSRMYISCFREVNGRTGISMRQMVREAQGLQEPVKIVWAILQTRKERSGDVCCEGWLSRAVRQR